MVIKNATIEKMVKQLTDLLPQQADTFKKDFQSACHHVLQKTFTDLNLVTREEFDIQNKVLQRTRQKLESLQQQIDELEKQLRDKQSK